MKLTTARIVVFTIVVLILISSLALPVVGKSVVLAQEPTATVIPPVTSNDQWKPTVQLANNAMMMVVPPGCFMMGNKKAIMGWDAAPVHKQCFEKPFLIDQSEVTNQIFAFYNGKAKLPPHWDYPGFPRDNITWMEARDFCKQRGARLPTEAEWEYAARGPSNLIYPWGNKMVPGMVNYGSNADNSTNAGSYPGNRSWVGAYDMSGNVWEWVSTIHKPYPYDAKDGREDLNDTKTVRILRGGSYWTITEEDLRTDTRFGEYADEAAANMGFRCASSM